VEARVFAAGLTSVLDRTLRRLTDPHAFERSGGTASSHRYLRSVKLDDVRFGANLLLSGQLQSASDECRVGLTLADARDSSRLRSASVEAPRGDGMALAERVLAAACQVLELGLAPAELHAVWRPGTHHALAYAEDLRGLGDLWAVTSRPAPKATPRSGGLPSVLTEGAPLDPARARAALLDDAQAAFRRALAADSTDSQAWLGLANVAWWEREGPEGIEAARRSAEACQRALELNLEDAGAHALLGEIYAQTDRDPAAVPELERASELDPTNDETLRQLARVYEHLGRVQDVERIYRVAVERRPDYYYWHSWYGYFCFKRARYDEAARHYQRAIDLAPGDALSYSYLGGVYLMQGRYQSAIPHFKASLALGPSRSAYSNLATVYFLTRRFAAAESTYLRAIELAKDDFLLWGNLGDAYYWDPVRRDSAATAYRRAWQLAQAKLETNQEDAGTLGLAAYYRAKLDKRSAARALLYRALALSPHDHDVLYKAALVHQQWGEADSALVYLDRALAAGHSRLWVQDTPELDALRPDPRYGRLWKK
jgi:tetratricopeptide (TPR) repeat protein